VIQVQGTYPPEFEPLVARLAEANLDACLEELRLKLAGENSPTTKKPYLESVLRQVTLNEKKFEPVEGRKKIEIRVCGLPKHPHIRKLAVKAITEMAYTSFGAHTTVQIIDHFTGVILMEKRCFVHVPSKKPAVQEEGTPLMDA
jgi:hypothetical protein